MVGKFGTSKIQHVGTKTDVPPAIEPPKRSIQGPKPRKPK